MDSPALIWLMAQRIERINDELQLFARELRTLQNVLSGKRPKLGTMKAAIVTLMQNESRVWTPDELLQALKDAGYDTTMGALRVEVCKLVRRDQKIQHVGRNQYRAAS